MLLSIAISIAMTVILGVALYFLNKGWRASIKQIIVALPLLLFVQDFVRHYQSEVARKRQSVIDILRVTIGNEKLSNAYSTLFDNEPVEVLKISVVDFDHKISPLSDLFWGVGACAAAEQCDGDVTRELFCFDFVTYRYAYLEVHPKEKRWQKFDNEPRLKVFDSCKNTHRFRDANGKDIHTSAP
jgi:hypothetical protein